MTQDDLSVQMIDIVKRFPGVLANDHVTLDVRRGEVHALLGENGAGKSTLMNMLYGLYRPDGGRILVNGRVQNFNSPGEAIKAGVGMIHQHFMLVQSHSVTENVILGMEGVPFVLNLGEAEKRVAGLGRQYGLTVDPTAKIWQLSVGEQQRVEIIKALYRGAQILIMDEPTAVLTPQEVKELFKTLRDMTKSNHTVIFISHKLDEVMEIADRITVLRKGKKIATINKADTNKTELAKMMVGRDVIFRVKKEKMAPGDVIMSVRNLRCDSDKGLPALRGVSLEIRANEILGIAGVAGNGQRELAQAITGLRAVTGGSVLVNGKDVTGKSPLCYIEEGVGYIPADRTGTGSVPNMNLAYNLILKNYRKPPVSRSVFIELDVVHKTSQQLIEQYDVIAPGIKTPSRLLSGGNLQKLILAREISACPNVLVAVYPVRGLDVGATEAIHQLLLEQRSGGAGVLLISEDLEELLSLSDRIAVIYEGQVMGIVEAEEADINEIGLMMAGTRKEEIAP